MSFGNWPPTGGGGPAGTFVGFGVIDADGTILNDGGGLITGVVKAGTGQYQISVSAAAAGGPDNDPTVGVQLQPQTDTVITLGEWQNGIWEATFRSNAGVDQDTRFIANFYKRS